MEKKEATVYDFTKVTIEERIGVFIKTDVSQALGNAIHQFTGDIGLDEIARAIYKNGKAEIPAEYITAIISILKDPKSPVVISVKVAVIEMLTRKAK